MRIPHRPKGKTPVLLLAGAAALLASACAADAPQDVLQPEGPFARQADDLWNLVLPIAAVIFVIVEGLLIYALIRFRHRPDRPAAQFHGNTRLEILLTAIPALILAGIAVPTVRTVFDISREPEGEMLNVTVVAHQFWWEYRYPDLGIVTANEMRIPVGVPVRVRLDGAATDVVDGTAEVIHAFWVPRLAGKQDIVPGRTNLITLQADRADRYLGQCTEYCGLGHANMRLIVESLERDDFDTWVRSMREPAPATLTGDAAEGERLFAEGQFAAGPACATCHAVDATQESPNAGPNLAGFAARETFAGAIFETNEQTLARWLRDPAAAKQGAKMPNLGLTEDQIAKLIAYLQTLE